MIELNRRPRPQSSFHFTEGFYARVGFKKKMKYKKDMVESRINNLSWN